MALALYRTYRPGSLAEVIGQEHVTDPLGRALAAGRIHHAYLFSGPRGCGKTSTARILARSLNCEQGPTATPCGQCRSCTELAPNGPGSIDVVELDAATHRGIDDARELREKAIYAPANSRFKVYILDEAHQLTADAANALLKIIEEPPPHLRFIFATTEPDKIIPTIRSRTFHYGFRLVPARTLAEHLAGVCRAEGVPAEGPALAVVARAGAGSVRDSLSVLGQLLAGAGPEGLTYADAVASLGLTDAALIDAFVEALSTGSPAAMFAVVDRVITAGHDPRRFVTDVLERLRDLVILRADPKALASGLVDVPDDAGERMLAQAESLGMAELSRAADLVSVALGELKGATAPRLQLELLCARLALPAGDDLASLLARIERLERGVGAPAPGGGPEVGAPAPAPARGASAARAAAGAAPATAAPAPEPTPPAPVAAPEPAIAAAPPARPAPGPSGPSGPPRRPQLRSTGGAAPEAAGGPAARQGNPGTAEAPTTDEAPGTSDARPTGGDAPPNHRPGEPTGTSDPTPAPAAPPAESTAPPGEAAAPTGAAAAPGRRAGGDDGSGDLTWVREGWEQVLARLGADSRVAWTAFHTAMPLSLSAGTLAVAVAEAGNVRAIAQRGHDERLRQALIDVLGLDVTIDVVHDPGAAGGTPGGPSPTPPAAAGPTRPPGQDPAGSPAPPPAPAAAERGSTPARPTAAGGSPRGAEWVRAAAQSRAGGEVEQADQPSEDDPDLSGADGVALLTRELGARPVGEIDHS